MVQGALKSVLLLHHFRPHAMMCRTYYMPLCCTSPLRPFLLSPLVPSALWLIFLVFQFHLHRHHCCAAPFILLISAQMCLCAALAVVAAKSLSLRVRQPHLPPFPPPPCRTPSRHRYNLVRLSSSPSTSFPYLPSPSSPPPPPNLYQHRFCPFPVSHPTYSLLSPPALAVSFLFLPACPFSLGPSLPLVPPKCRSSHSSRLH